MGKSYKKLTLIITLIFILSLGYSQTNEIKVKFIGNCGLYLTDGNLTIYVDFPYKSGAHNYMEYDKFELDSIKDNSIFLFTHRHSDHYAKKLIKKLNRDTGDTGPLSKIENIEWVFAPFWLYKNAMVENITINTKMFGIYHLYPDQEIGNGFSENVHFMTEQNEIISIPY